MSNLTDKFIAHISPVFFAAIGVYSPYLIYEGFRNGYILFGVRNLYSFERVTNPVGFYLVVAFFACASLVSLKMMVVTWRWRHDDD